VNPQALAQCQSIAADIMSNVTAAQMELPTPCANWNVGQLIDHMVGAQLWGMSSMTGAEQTETGEGASQGDYQATFQAAAAACNDCFSEDGALEKMVNPGFGEMPGAAMLGLVMTDTFQHAWDLATATGQDNNIAPEMAQALLGGAQQSISPNFRSEDGAIFGMEQQAPEGASAAAQLAAFLGRTV